MTCIAGIRHNGRVWIGADSAGACVSTHEILTRIDPKVFIKGDFVIGFTWSFRMGQLLRYSLDPPKRGRKGRDEYMVTDFMDSVRKCFSDGGFQRKKDEVEQGGEFMVGYQGKLYVVGSNYQIEIPSDPYYATGSGGPTALGVLYATRHGYASRNGHDPVYRIKEALAASERFNMTVRRPFVVKSVGKED